TQVLVAVQPQRPHVRQVGGAGVQGDAVLPGGRDGPVDLGGQADLLLVGAAAGVEQGLIFAAGHGASHFGNGVSGAGGPTGSRPALPAGRPRRPGRGSGHTIVTASTYLKRSNPGPAPARGAPPAAPSGVRGRSP